MFKNFFKENKNIEEINVFLRLKWKNERQIVKTPR